MERLSFRSLRLPGTTRSPDTRQHTLCPHCRLARPNFFEDALPPGAVEFINRIGAGSFGDVWKGNYYGGPVAIKCLKTSDLRPFESRNPSSIAAEMKRMEHEAAILGSLKHPNVLFFFAFCYKPPCIITEYCPNGSLYDILHGKPHLARDWTKKLHWVKGIAAGMRYLHDRQPPICHSDLKSANILISCTGDAIIADVGLSKFVTLQNQPPEDDHSPGCLNYLWQPPEVICNRTTAAYSEKSDVYSTGIIMWELLTSQIPFDVERRSYIPTVAYLHQIARRIAREGLRPEIPEDLTQIFGWDPVLERYVALMKRCWSYHLDERPTFADLEAEIIEIEKAYDEAQAHKEDALPEEEETQFMHSKDMSVVVQGGVQFMHIVASAVILWKNAFSSLDICDRLAYGVIGIASVTALFFGFCHLFRSKTFKDMRSWMQRSLRRDAQGDRLSFATFSHMLDGDAAPTPRRSPFEMAREGASVLAPNLPLPSIRTWNQIRDGLLRELPNHLGHAWHKQIQSFCVRHNKGCPTQEEWQAVQRIFLNNDAAKAMPIWAEYEQRYNQSCIGPTDPAAINLDPNPDNNAVSCMELQLAQQAVDYFTEKQDDDDDFCGLSCASTGYLTDAAGSDGVH